MTRNLKGDSREGNENKGERKLTSGSRGKEDSGFVDWSAGECSAKRNFEVTRE